MDEWADVLLDMPSHQLQVLPLGLVKGPAARGDGGIGERDIRRAEWAAKAQDGASSGQWPVEGCAGVSGRGHGAALRAEGNPGSDRGYQVHLDAGCVRRMHAPAPSGPRGSLGLFPIASCCLFGA